MLCSDRRDVAAGTSPPTGTDPGRSGSGAQAPPITDDAVLRRGVA